MVFCSHCGEKIADDANFCYKCGVRTRHGMEAGVPVPTEQLREAFSRMGLELEKAFQTAANEIQKALKNARQDYRDSRNGEVVCQGCGEKSPTGSAYCAKCGQKLQ